MRRLLGSMLMVLLASACSRQPERVAPSVSSVQDTREKGVSEGARDGGLGTLPLATELSLPAAKRVVAIGDLHGDLAAARSALKLAGAIDDNDAWIGGALVVVQTGDILDRGDGERAILDLTDRLREDARKTGGAVVLLSGNHELMNVAQDFRYVTPGGFAAFAPEGGRDVAFRPGGPWARRLATRPVFSRVGDTVFVHGGILPKHVHYGLTRLADEVRAWMLGQRQEPPTMIMAEDAVVWSRVYSFDTQEEGCQQLTEALGLLGAKRMVVGHTPQLQGITSACDERVWRIDTGMSGHYGGTVEVLEIVGDQVTPRREEGATEPRL